MTVIPFRYTSGWPRNRPEMLLWISAHGGVITRDPGFGPLLGIIRTVTFEHEEDAVAFKIKFRV